LGIFYIKEKVAWIKMFLTLHHASAICFVFSSALNEANLEKNVFFSSKG
jgi:hypothetical protein